MPVSGSKGDFAVFFFFLIKTNPAT